MKPKIGSLIQERLLKGFGAQGFSQMVQVFIRVAEVPLLLSFWGTQLYGEWLMLSAIPSYLSIGDIGFTCAACREMTMRSGAGNRKGTVVVFQSTWVLLIVVSITTGLLAFSFVLLAPIADWLGFSIMTSFDVKIALYILVVYVLVGFQGGLINGGFWVMGRYSSSMYFIAITQALEFGGLAIAVTLGGGPLQGACGYLFGRLLGTILMWIGQCWVNPWLRHGISYVSFKELRRLTAPAFASIAFPLGHALNIQGIRLVVGLVLGPSALALFVPLRTLSRLVMQPSIIINRLIEPELALAYGAGNIPLFQRLYEKSCQFALWGSFLACFLVTPGAFWIFQEWTGGKVTMNWPIYFVLLSAVCVNSIWYTAMLVPIATNRHGRIALSFALVYGATAIGLSYIGATSLELVGTAFSLLIVEGAMAVIVMHESLKLAQVTKYQWIKIILNPIFFLHVQAKFIVKKKLR